MTGPGQGGVLLQPAYVDWFCPECSEERRTPPLPPNGAAFHNCPRLHGLTVPLIRAGSDAHITAKLREDYVKGEHVQTAPDDGRPYMAAITRYADGSNDATVYAPAAVARLGG